MSADPLGAVFSALADPTRRQLVSELATGETATASGLAEGLPMTRQAVTKHLAALEQAGLVEGRRSGREVRYRLTPRPLEDAVSWMTAVGGQWDERLAALRRHLEA